MDEHCDWAIVLVHGIGDRDAGSTLERFGSPLAEFALANHGPGSSVERRDGEWLVHLLEGAEVRRWRLVEVHWRDVVAPPTYPQLFRWLVLVAPWILHADALQWSERRRPVAGRPMWWHIWRWVWMLPWLRAFTRGMVLLTAGAVVQLVLTLVAVVGLVPALRGPARWAQSRLVGSIGDSFAYLYDTATWQRIERRLVDTVEAASLGADQVAVVTHSQGTAVMHRSLADGSMPDVVDEWVSLGSGLQKLMTLRLTTTRRLIGWAVLRTLALGFFFASIPFWRYVEEAATGEEVPSDLVAVAFLVAMVGMWAPFLSVRRLRAKIRRLVVAPLGRYSLRWLDLYSFHDPVPGGPMPGSTDLPSAGRPTSHEVFNEGSFVRDHTAYMANVEQVVRPIHDRLAPPTWHPFAATLAVERRVRRVGARPALTVLALGTGFALASPAVRFGPEPLGVVAWAVTVWLSMVVLGGAWRRWHRRETGLARVQPRPAGSLRSTVGVIAGWSFLALLAAAVTEIGVEVEGGDLLFIAVSWGRTLTLLFALLAIGLLLTVDYRAYVATNRSFASSDDGDPA